MPTTKHIIDLTDTDRKYLTDIVKKGSSPAKTILRANILRIVQEKIGRSKSNGYSRNNIQMQKKLSLLWII